MAKLNMASKTAVILFNLGGPDSPRAIRPFLFNFFTDPNIIRLTFFPSALGPCADKGNQRSAAVAQSRRSS